MNPVPANSLPVSPASVIPDSIRRLLRCPRCQSPVTVRADHVVCLSAACRVQYPIRDGLAGLVTELGEELDDAAWGRIVN